MSSLWEALKDCKHIRNCSIDKASRNLQQSFYFKKNTHSWIFVVFLIWITVNSRFVFSSSLSSIMLLEGKKCYFVFCRGSCRTKARLQFVLMIETLKWWPAWCLRMSLLSPLWPHLTSAAMFLFVHLACLLIQLPGDMHTPSPPLYLSPSLCSSPPRLSIFSWNWWFNEDLSHHEWPLCYCFFPVIQTCVLGFVLWRPNITRVNLIFIALFWGKIHLPCTLQSKSVNISMTQQS